MNKIAVAMIRRKEGRRTDDMGKTRDEQWLLFGAVSAIHWVLSVSKRKQERGSVRA